MLERRFTQGDQQAFAELSGDFNPIHIDPVIARRSLFGQQIVHGIHLLLWALDSWAASQTQQVMLRSLKADFHSAVGVDQIVTYRLVKEENRAIWIELKTEGKTVATIKALFEPIEERVSKVVPQGRPDRKSPRIICAEKMAEIRGDLAVYLDTSLAKNLFPNAPRIFPTVQVAELLATTRIVGMECPGLHSIYSGLELTFCREVGEDNVMNYEVTDYDDRYFSLLMSVAGPGTKGKIRAFLRPAPWEQISSVDVQKVVKPNEFAQQRALVIGGSRGLGEVTAKLLAAGGADLKITYYQGLDDARRIVDEIVSSGGVAECFHFDVLKPGEGLANRLGGEWSPTHLYYFATPFIFAAIKGKFSPQLFQKFCDYYVAGFLNTVKEIQNIGASLQKIFYPSSVAVDELPVSMGEYTAAKAAGETLCAFLEKTDKGIKIIKSRLPRLATDQTSSLLPTDNQDPVPILLEELRALRDA